ncbi:MAG: IS1595 family transposase [Chloroflexota bacterium]
MGARRTGDYPRTLSGFYRRFPDDEACLAYLIETRWPDAFRCPGCGSADHFLLARRRIFYCRKCRRHTSATAGTTMHGSKVALHAWFQAAWLMTSLAPGISALQLSRQLGLRFATAWLLLHKLRRATVNPERERLKGDVEMDDAWIGGAQAGLKGGHQRAGRTALQVIIAVERRSDASLGRARMAVIPNDDAKTIREFVTASIERGATVFSDAHTGYPGALADGYTHRPLSQQAMKRKTGTHTSAAPGVDRVISNLKTWLMGTHHGVGADHLDAYLDEFVFRFNRRHNRAAGFASLLGLTTEVPPATAAVISPLSATAKRRGRSTGQTGLVHRNPPPPLPGAAPRRKAVRNGAGGPTPAARA